MQADVLADDPKFLFGGDLEAEVRRRQQIDENGLKLLALEDDGSLQGRNSGYVMIT